MPWSLHLPRQEALLLFAVLFLLGGAYVAARLVYSRKHGLSFRLQVFLALAGITLLVTGAFGIIVVDRFEARTILFAQRAAADDAQVVQVLVERSMGLFGVSLEQGAQSLGRTRVLYGFTQEDDETRVQLLDRQGQVLFDSWTAKPAQDLARQPEVRQVLQEATGPPGQAGPTDQTGPPGQADQTDPVALATRRLEKNKVAAVVPLRRGDALVGAVRVTKSTFGMNEVVSDLAPKVALLALILAGAAALAGVVVGRSVARPVERLTQAAARIASGERQGSLPVPRGREVRALTQAFEDMRRELEQRHAVEALAADLSHELKNPVASIRAAAEVLEDALDNDPEMARRFLSRISQSAVRLEALLADLLGLAGLEARGIAAEAQELDFSVLVESTQAAVRGQAEAKQVRLHARVEPMHLRGSRTWLQRALQNLLANAITASPHGGQVTVVAQSRDRFLELAVRDQGEGIPEAIREKIFERFITTRHDQGGTGLGLAIVRAVAEAHGGQVTVRETSAQGTTMVLSLPL